MKKSLIIVIVLSISAIVLFLILKPKGDLTDKATALTGTKREDLSKTNHNELYLAQKVDDLERENERLRNTRPQQVEPQIASPENTLLETAEKPPEENSAKAAQNMDMAPRPEVKNLKSSPVDPGKRAITMAIESQLRQAHNSEEDDRKLLKKAELTSPSSTIASTNRASEEKILDLRGDYEGKLAFTSGKAGSIALKINFEKQSDKNVGQFAVKIIDQAGKVQSDVTGNGGSIDIRSLEGSEAVFLKVSPYEELQIFVKDNGTLLGNYYERPKPGEELQKTASFHLVRI